MSTSRAELIKELKKQFPNIEGIRPSEELGWSKGGIFLGDVAEGGTIDGINACDYYVHDSKEKYYIMGVHKELHALLEKHGWFAESHDPGTYFAWE